jgi:hypothetical protein
VLRLPRSRFKGFIIQQPSQIGLDYFEFCRQHVELLRKIVNQLPAADRVVGLGPIQGLEMRSLRVATRRTPSPLVARVRCCPPCARQRRSTQAWFGSAFSGSGLPPRIHWRALRVHVPGVGIRGSMPPGDTYNPKTRCRGAGLRNWSSPGARSHTGAGGRVIRPDMGGLRGPYECSDAAVPRVYCMSTGPGSEVRKMLCCIDELTIGREPYV